MGTISYTNSLVYLVKALWLIIIIIIIKVFIQDFKQTLKLTMFISVKRVLTTVVRHNILTFTRISQSRFLYCNF